ncbi:MAG: anti-sigma factor domain-containing protein [Acidobacteriota bacterium]
MPKGTVVEKYRSRAVIMTDTCEFIEVKIKSHVMVGDEILYTPSDILSVRRAVLKAVAMAASFVLFCALSYFTMQGYAEKKVYAQIAMDINPSLEININKDYRVVDARGFNADGTALLQKVDLEGMALNTAVYEVLKQCKNDNQLKLDKSNVIGVAVYSQAASDNQTIIKEVNKDVTAGLNQTMVPARIYTFEVDSKTHEQCLKIDISPTNYILWKQAQNKGLKYTSPQDISLHDPLINDLANEAAKFVFGSGILQGGTSGEKSSSININTPKGSVKIPLPALPVGKQSTDPSLPINSILNSIYSNLGGVNVNVDIQNLPKPEDLLKPPAPGSAEKKAPPISIKIQGSVGDSVYNGVNIDVGH